MAEGIDTEWIIVERILLPLRCFKQLGSFGDCAQLPIMYIYLFSSGTPSFPNVGTAHQFLANPVVAEAAAQYGHGLVTMGQSYLDRNVQ